MLVPHCRLSVSPVVWLRGRLSWVAFLIALGGLTTLGYGFSNVPALPGLAIPLVDVILIGTLIGLVLTGVHWPVPRTPFVLASLLFAWASVRLLIDYPAWGALAWRDYSTYVELSALFVGYWLMVQVGLDRWIKALSWVFVAVVIYGLWSFKVTHSSRSTPPLGFNNP